MDVLMFTAYVGVCLSLGACAPASSAEHGARALRLREQYAHDPLHGGFQHVLRLFVHLPDRGRGVFENPIGHLPVPAVFDRLVPAVEFPVGPKHVTAEFDRAGIDLHPFRLVFADRGDDFALRVRQHANVQALVGPGVRGVAAVLETRGRGLQGGVKLRVRGRGAGGEALEHGVHTRDVSLAEGLEQQRRGLIHIREQFVAEELALAGVQDRAVHGGGVLLVGIDIRLQGLCLGRLIHFLGQIIDLPAHLHALRLDFAAEPARQKRRRNEQQDATTAMMIGTSRARLFLRFLRFLRKLSFLTRLRSVSRSMLGELIRLPASIRLRFYFVAFGRRTGVVTVGAGAALFGASFHTSLNCNLNQ